MRDLVVFELKKIVARKVTRVSVLALFALTALVFGLNVFQQVAFDEQGRQLGGFAAIEQNRSYAEALEGPLTDEAAAEAVASYARFFDEKGDVLESVETDEQARAEFTRFDAAYGSYLYLILTPSMNGYEPTGVVASRVVSSGADDLYGAREKRLERQLDEGMNGSWTYSDAERALWTEKLHAVPTPVAYGYAGGWSGILDCINFLFFGIVAVCIGIAPVFAAEYQDRTDAVILSTRYGKSKLVAAKIIAAFAFATAVFAANAAVAVGIPLACYGAAGADLPVQLNGLAIPYDATMSQAVGICLGIGYLVTLGLTALTLLLSARMKSPLSIFAIAAAVVVLPGFLPKTPFGIVNHLLYLAPMNSIDFTNLFNALVSYPFGTLVLDLQTMAVVLQVAVIALCVPLAAWSFRRHQVS
jgi:ABC-type transport system involved in multi-copper enzyme maturation permease subunit